MIRNGVLFDELLPSGNADALRQAIDQYRQHLDTFQESRDATADLFANTLTTAVGVTIAVATAGAGTPISITLLLGAAGADGATQAGARFLLQGSSYNTEVLVSDLVAGGLAGATSVLTPFNFSANFESSLARFLVGGARGALNGGSVGFVQGASTAALQDSTWEPGITLGFQTVLANGWQSALMGIALGAPLEALVAAVRPYELQYRIVQDAELPRSRGANDEVGPRPPREGVAPDQVPVTPDVTARDIEAGRQQMAISRQTRRAVMERLSSNPTDAEITAVLRDLGSVETVTPEMIQEVRQYLRGEASGTVGKPEWLRRMEAGQEFNRTQQHRYTYNEVYVVKAEGNGYWILDSYSPGSGEIVSRKFTQLANVQEATAIGYLNELATKYPPNATIADVPSRHPSLAGQHLEGVMILEVPVQTTPVPQSVLDAARDLDIQIRDVNGRIYNP